MSLPDNDAGGAADRGYAYGRELNYTTDAQNSTKQHAAELAAGVASTGELHTWV